MVFNRKKAEGMAEGIVLAIIAATNVMDGDGGGTLQEKEEDTSSLPRLMLLLRVIHQVFMEGKDDSDQFEKSAQLRTILADVALIPLFQALANNTATASETEQQQQQQQQQRETYHSEVKEMIDSWKEFSVFDGPTVWEGYKKAWGRAVVDAASNAATTKSGGDEGTTNDSIVDASPPDGESRSSTNDAPMDVTMGGQSSTLEEGTSQPSTSLSLTKDDSSETNQGEDDAIKKKEATATIALSSSTPTESPSIEDTNNNKMEVTNTNQDDEKPSLSNKRDSMTSVTSIDIDFDAEGVEEADVEPATFLEASKVIASLQIARGTFFFIWFCTGTALDCLFVFGDCV